jgi:hypothetical protein
MNWFFEICDDYEKKVPGHIRQAVVWGVVLAIAIVTITNLVA